MRKVGEVLASTGSTGAAYAAAWYQTPWGSMGERLLQAIRVPGVEPDEFLGEYQRASRQTFTGSAAVPGRDVVECVDSSWWPETLYLYASGDTLYILHDPAMAEALPE